MSVGKCDRDGLLGTSLRRWNVKIDMVFDVKTIMATDIEVRDQSIGDS